MLSARCTYGNRHALLNAMEESLFVAGFPGGDETFAFSGSPSCFPSCNSSALVGGSCSLSGGSIRGFGGRGVGSLSSGLYSNQGLYSASALTACSKDKYVGVFRSRDGACWDISRLIEMAVHRRARTYSSPSLLTLFILSTPKSVSAVSFVS